MSSRLAKSALVVALGLAAFQLARLALPLVAINAPAPPALSHRWQAPVAGSAEAGRPPG
jgi:hypothetical protein